jgi:pilus assembly protein FimV
MMMAIYQANPNAFYKDNVNAMMAGKTLKIPDKEIIVKLSRSQALTEFNKQNNAWKNRVLTAPVKTTVGTEEAVNNQLKLIAPAEDTVADDTVVSPNNDKVALEQKSARQAGLAANSGASASSPADAAIESKIAALEKQLAVMQQLIVLKDQQLAAIQNQSQQIEQSKSQTQEQTTSTTPVPSPVIAPQAVLEPTIEAPVNSPIQQPTGEPVSTTPVPEPVVDSSVAKPTQPPIVKLPVVQPPVVSEDSFDFYYLGVAGVGAAVIGLLGWMWRRKRNMEEETGAESMFASSSLIRVPDEEDAFSVPVSSDGTAYTVGESSFLSEFTPSDFNSFDTDQGEIDPISEADVYLAYGRYQQAEELMHHAIKDHPERDECKLKLLEIYYASENKQAFIAYADDLVKSGKNKQVDFWAKVAEMGEELCPGVALFSSGDAHFAANESVMDSKTDGNEADPEELDFGLVSFEELPVKNKTLIVEKNKESELDYDLTSFDVEGDIFDVEDSNNQDIDFDLDSFANETVNEDGDKAEAVSNIDDLETYDFNFDVIDTKKTPIAETSLSASKQKITPADKLTLDDSLTFDSDDFDFSYNLDKTDSSSKSDKFAVSDLTDMDELETKLDLAKAYVDMGDIGAARDIASEVLTNGTDLQKAAAQELLDDLS